MDLEDISVVFQILRRGDRFTAARSIMHIIEVTPLSFVKQCTRPSLALLLHLCDDDKGPKHHYSTANYEVQRISSSNGQTHAHLHAFTRSSTILKPGSWVPSISTSVPVRGDDDMTKGFPHLA